MRHVRPQLCNHASAFQTLLRVTLQAEYILSRRNTYSYPYEPLSKEQIVSEVDNAASIVLLFVPSYDLSLHMLLMIIEQ